MSNIIYLSLILLIQTIIVTYYYVILSKSITNDIITKKDIILSFVMALIADIIIYITKTSLNMPILNSIITALLLSLIPLFCFKVSFLKSIFITVIYYIVSAITEILTYLLIANFGITAEMLTVDYTKLLILISLQQSMIFLLVFLYYLFVRNKENIKSKIQYIDFKLLLVMLAGYILPQLLLFSLTYYTYPLPLLIINIIQIILVSFLIFKYFGNEISKEKTKAEMTVLETQNKALSEAVDSVRIQKHDYNNIIQALNGYVATKNYDRLKDYVDSLLKECHDINTLSAINPDNFNDPGVYGIVGSKYFYTNDHDIKFDIEMESDIKSICFPKPELSRIFGILLDNAIEATQKTSNKYLKLEVSYDTRKNADVIKISNTFDSSANIDLNQIYEKGVSSKKVKSGLGLWEVSKLIKKNKHSQIYAEVKNDVFTQNVIIERI